MLVIPELESWEAEEQTFKASLNHRASLRLALKKTNKNNKSIQEEEDSQKFCKKSLILAA